jgi:hypothetical protein
MSLTVFVPVVSRDGQWWREGGAESVVALFHQLMGDLLIYGLDEEEQQPDPVWSFIEGEVTIDALIQNRVDGPSA